ncbi:AAA family ATPase [Sinorhizobium meliloti]|uniref:AAA family ATPase n=1 Tax=Rhizobium meliloti TaxID=382 RepID=UPI001F196025|nr:ATP-binding protein [Sinorhizobium meliloti]
MLLEREGPLKALLAAARSAALGHGSIVVVEGEAGIGKTTLLREFAEHSGNSCRVLWGWCEALFTPCPPRAFARYGATARPACGSTTQAGGSAGAALSGTVECAPTLG